MTDEVHLLILYRNRLLLFHWEGPDHYVYEAHCREYILFSNKTSRVIQVTPPPIEISHIGFLDIHRT